MAIYFDGFDDKMLSFYSESGRWVCWHTRWPTNM